MPHLIFIFYSALTDRQDGIIKWTDERSLQLLRAIQANLIVLNVGKRGAGKAWERVHEMMMDTGLPQCTTKALKKRWERMRNNHKYSFDDYRKQSSKKVTNVEPLGVLDHAIRELYQNNFATDHAQKRIRAEPDDERHETPTKKTKIRPTSAANDEDQSKAAMPQLITKTPVVGLERLNMSESTVLPVPRQQSTASSDANATSSATALGEVQLTGSASVDCGTNVYERKLAQLQVEAAQQDVLFKKAQLEHEKKRAEFERQLQQKKLQILDLEAQKVRMMMEMMQHDRDRANLNGWLERIRYDFKKEQQPIGFFSSFQVLMFDIIWFNFQSNTNL